MIPVNDLLDARPGIGMIAGRFEWLVTTRTLEVQGYLTPTVGASMTFDSSANIMRSVRGVSLRQDEVRDLDLFNDRLMPLYVLEDGSGDPELGGWPLGVFLFSDRIRDRARQHTLHNVTLMDAGFQLDVEASSSYSLPQGARIFDAMVDVIHRSGFLIYDVSPTDQKTGELLNWPIGTHWAVILKDLARLANFHPPFFDNRGTLRLRAPLPLEYGVGHVYDLAPNGRVQPGTIHEADNLLSAPNVYIVTGNGVGNAQIVARSYVDARLPHSRERISYERPHTVQLQGLTDSAHAQRLADVLAAADPGQLEQIDFVGPLDPRHDAFDVVEYDQSLYREVRWDANLTPGGDMKHSLARQMFDAQGVAVG